MNSEMLHNTSEENLNQLKEEIKQGLMDAVNNSKLIELFERYGLTGDGIVKFRCIIDINKIQSSDVVVDQQLQQSLLATRSQEIVIAPCECWCTNPPRICCNCKQ
jgi:Ca2+-binding EF-hand superfamily protein